MTALTIGASQQHMLLAGVPLRCIVLVGAASQRQWQRTPVPFSRRFQRDHIAGRPAEELCLPGVCNPSQCAGGHSRCHAAAAGIAALPGIYHQASLTSTCSLAEAVMLAACFCNHACACIMLSWNAFWLLKFVPAACQVPTAASRYRNACCFDHFAYLGE